MSILEFKKVNCKDCYKCVRYCPVKSIRVKDHAASILAGECILCGNCTIVCPQHAKEDINDVPMIKVLMSKHETVIAIVAPSFAAYFNISFETMKSTLKKLGFADVFEVAEGAHVVKNEYERLVAENPDQTWITSSCASVNYYIKRHRPEAAKYLLPVLTPMKALAKILRERYPEAKFVFIGPCLSKKGEAFENGSGVSAVLLFEELEDWLAEENIVVHEDESFRNQPRLSRLFPMSGGILATMKQEPGINYLPISGFDGVKQTIEDVIDGKLPHCFIEMNFCKGGCVGGPSFRRKELGTLRGAVKTRQAAGTTIYDEDYNVPEPLDYSTTFQTKRVFRLEPTKAQIEAVLRQMDKFSPEDELNCGMCGYSTCREKARAVLFGKAEIDMCMPYIRKRAENYAGKIIDSVPSGILAIDMSLNISQANPAACDIFGVDATSLVGQPIGTILDENDFVNLLASDEDTLMTSIYLPDYGLYLDETLQVNRDANLIICILKNVTEEKTRHRRAMQKRQQTAAIADEIVEKQLRMVHEIASLLGETASETKIAISDLKESVMMEDDNV
ncbi:MAG: [Fe-Fe] hydrogenase large subunit C-terminal domain-containing protein [Peptococcaceae bacterium]|nr:[Fe-Fe] hydrogenase large subunit C-terminal domain-containing protein [Peptococcaceae bacterium]